MTDFQENDSFLSAHRQADEMPDVPFNMTTESGIQLSVTRLSHRRFNIVEDDRNENNSSK